MNTCMLKTCERLRIGQQASCFSAFHFSRCLGRGMGGSKMVPQSHLASITFASVAIWHKYMLIHIYQSLHLYQYSVELASMLAVLAYTPKMYLTCNYRTSQCQNILLFNEMKFNVLCWNTKPYGYKISKKQKLKCLSFHVSHILKHVCRQTVDSFLKVPLFRGPTNQMYVNTTK